jgi:hypothetical protein
MSKDTEGQPRKTVPWLQIATLFVTVTVTVARFVLDLWRKG